MIAGTVALFIENARVSEQLKQAYREVTSSNKAKEKAINHLSHELKTPLSVPKASLSFLEKKMKTLPADVWKPGMERARRNLNRILDGQQQVEDIMQDRPYKIEGILSLLLGECTDEVEALAADETGEESAAGRIRKRIEETFGGKKDVIAEIDPGVYLPQRIEALKARFAHREVEIVSDLEEGAPSYKFHRMYYKKLLMGS